MPSQPLPPEDLALGSKQTSKCGNAETQKSKLSEFQIFRVFAFQNSLLRSLP